MQTVREPNEKSGPGLPYRTYQHAAPQAVSQDQEKRLKMNELKSWMACFLLIFVITGTLKVLSLGITMESVTSLFFYGSLAALIYLSFRFRSLYRKPVSYSAQGLHELN